MILEVSTTVGCPIQCPYCPQKDTAIKYQGERRLTLDTFRKCLAHCPSGATLIFAGVAELVRWYDSLGKEVSSTSLTHAEWVRSKGYKVANPIWVKTTTPDELLRIVGWNFDFLNIDTEHTNLKVLRAFPLRKMDGLRLLCVENESPEENRGFIISYAQDCGFRLLHEVGCNLLMGRT